MGVYAGGYSQRAGATSALFLAAIRSLRSWASSRSRYSASDSCIPAGVPDPPIRDVHSPAPGRCGKW